MIRFLSKKEAWNTMETLKEVMQAFEEAEARGREGGNGRDRTVAA